MFNNPAQEASKRALEQVFACIENGDSFLLEAGAGAGKTYSLIKTLHFLIDRYKLQLQKSHQKIACITYTNVAKDEIEARTDKNPLIHCDTIHAFCWSLINSFQKHLREKLPEMGKWSERIDKFGGLGNQSIAYTLGYRSIQEHQITLHHDDVLMLTIDLLGKVKFRRVVATKYPVILIDEYQDTSSDWIESIKTHYLGKPDAPLFGFFGDHWQKIYGDGCGKITHPALIEIGKEANFRSVPAIVDCLNRMRVELPQCVEDPNAIGDVYVFQTNEWSGSRETGSHTKGDLPSEVSSQVLRLVRSKLEQQGWDFSPSQTKVLMLTHRVLANEQGYSNLFNAFKENESFIKKENRHIAFLVDTLEPACEAFINKQYGAMFTALGSKVPIIQSKNDKEQWTNSINTLIEIRSTGSVADVVKHLRATKNPRLPDSIEKTEQKLLKFDHESDEEMPRSLKELEKLHAVPYQEVIALRKYLIGHSPFQTNHGVKGAQFENVLVVLGRGWNHYNFGQMLEMARKSRIPETDRKKFERNRNLFYVACSRPQKRLALLFTQELSTPDCLTQVL